MTPEQISAAWRKLWGSVAFRLTFNYSLLAACTTVIVLLFVYIQIVNLLQMQFSRQISLTAHRLVAIYEQEGPESLESAIKTLLSDQTDVDSEMYLLLDSQGRKLAGNLDVPAAGQHRLAYATSQDEPVFRNGVASDGFLRAEALDNGWTLIVGHDVRDLREIKSLIGQAMLVMAFVALLLVTAGTYIFRVALMWRVQDIRDTATQVGTGKLTHRVPDAEEEDEFAGLRGDINQMLDRIEALMSGVRNVSDSIAHNLRTPLARVLAKLHTARNAQLDSKARVTAIEESTQEIMDLIAVTEKLLLIAEAESGVRRQAFHKVRLDDIVQDAIDLFEPLASEKGILFDYCRMSDDAAPSVSSATLAAHKSIFDPPPDPGPQVWADADLLAGVVVNVIENALKYAGQGARVTIRTSQQGRIARLLIEDNGPGVQDQHLEQIGTRFYRLSPGAPGFGLGLASVKAIISLHDGQVWFETANPGFRVRVELPAALA